MRRRLSRWTSTRQSPSRADAATVSGDEAFERALHALRHRDRSADEIDRRLAEHGFSDDEREQALERLLRAGLVDDTRFARARAESLAARGSGDEAVRRALRTAGVDPLVAEEAIAALEPEAARALRIVAARGRGPRTARYLFAHGFATEVVTEVVAATADQELP